MDEELRHFETELKRLRPSPAPLRLEEALARRLDAPAPRWVTATTWRSWKWALWSVAAAALLVLAFTAPEPEPPVERTWPTANRPLAAEAPKPGLGARPGRDFRPVAAERQYLGSAREEWVTRRDGTAVRQLRRDYVDTVTWRDHRGAAAVRWVVPGEEIQPLPWPLD